MAISKYPIWLVLGYPGILAEVMLLEQRSYSVNVTGSLVRVQSYVPSFLQSVFSEIPYM